jgi:hypothetical protein
MPRQRGFERTPEVPDAAQHMRLKSNEQSGIVVYRDRTLETIASGGGHVATDSNEMSSAYGKAVVDRMDRLASAERENEIRETDLVASPDASSPSYLQSSAVTASRKHDTIKASRYASSTIPRREDESLEVSPDRNSGPYINDTDQYASKLDEMGLVSNADHQASKVDEEGLMQLVQTNFSDSKHYRGTYENEANSSLEVDDIQGLKERQAKLASREA